MDIENIDNLDNFENLDNFKNLEISFVRKCISFFLMLGVFFNGLMILFYYFDVEPFATYLYNNISKFITKFQNGLSKKLLAYNGHFSDFDSDCTDSDSEVSSTDLIEVIKYEDKYLDDIKKMSMDYRFSWAEITLRDNKFNELFDLYKTNLEKQFIEKSMKYLELDSDFFLETDKKEAEEEIILLRTKIKEFDSNVKEFDSNVKEFEDEECEISKLKMEAHNFVIKERLDGLKNNFIFEKTPLGNVIMYWNNSRESFEFYSDNTIPYRYLETVGRKYVKTFNCRQIYVDMEFELSEFERKQKEKQDDSIKLLEEKQKMELEQNTGFNSNLGKKNVFAKFKNYNKESGTGKVNRGAAPPKNSIPNNNNVKKADEKTILKENANRYTCEGKIANFSFLKKPDRKIIDKKYAMSFADYKKLNL